MDFQHSRQHVLQYWAGTPLQHQQANRLYRCMRVGAAQRERSRNRRARLLSPGYILVTHQDWTPYFRVTVFSVGPHFWCKACDYHWWLGKTSTHAKMAAHYVVRFLSDPGPVKLKF